MSRPKNNRPLQHLLYSLNNTTTRRSIAWAAGDIKVRRPFWHVRPKIILLLYLKYSRLLADKTVMEDMKTMTNAILNQPRSIRQNRAPLTLEQIRKAAPSAFAEEAFAGMSSRYAYIPTAAVIENLMRAGFQVFAASQSRTKDEGRQNHVKHMIRFRQSGAALSVGEIFPEVVLVNGHDGSSRYKLMGGLFRLICSNGAIIADSLIGSVNVRHTGNVIEQVATGTLQIVEHMPKAIDAVKRWRDIQLSAGERTAFAEAAHAYRFADADGAITTPIRPAQLLEARRAEDTGADLWSVFNRVQENVVKGGLTAWGPNRRRRTSREVKGIDQDVKLNRALWIMAEKLAEAKG